MRFNLTRADINNNSETRRQFSRFSQNQILSKKSHQNVQNYAMSFNRAISIAFQFLDKQYFDRVSPLEFNSDKAKGKSNECFRMQCQDFSFVSNKSIKQNICKSLLCSGHIEAKFCFISPFLSKILPGKKPEADKMTKLYP